jgi:hypothetical protein
MTLSEHDLIEAARAGDAPALEALLTRHAPARAASMRSCSLSVIRCISP